MTATAKVSPAHAVTGWLAATVTNYAAAPARPVAIHIGAAGSLTFTDGTTAITVILPGIHYLSPLNVTALTAPAHVLFQ